MITSQQYRPLDDLNRDDLPTAPKAVADALDDWLHRKHGILSGHHGVGLLLDLLADEGYAIEAAARPAESRTFHLQRDEDVTGASGTGHVADGVLWPDGTVTVKWRGEYASEVSWPKGMEAVERIHGHDGRTRIVWDDEGQRG